MYTEADGLTIDAAPGNNTRCTIDGVRTCIIIRIREAALVAMQSNGAGNRDCTVRMYEDIPIGTEPIVAGETPSMTHIIANRLYNAYVRAYNTVDTGVDYISFERALELESIHE